MHKLLNSTSNKKRHCKSVKRPQRHVNIAMIVFLFIFMVHVNIVIMSIFIYLFFLALQILIFSFDFAHFLVALIVIFRLLVFSSERIFRILYCQIINLIKNSKMCICLYSFHFINQCRNYDQCT